MRRLLAVLAALTLVAGACGDDDDDDGGGTASDTTAPAATTGAQTYTVEVDAEAGDFAASNLAYFPKQLTARPGDTVSFHSNDTGDPHTVTFGTIADSIVKAFEALPPEVLQSDGPPPAEFLALDEKLPPLLPDGPGDANQLAANPCFLASGDPAPDQACPAVSPQPAFTGTESVYNSGYLPDDATFSMKLADDLAPGTYKYFCLLHRVGMTGTLTVVAPDAPVPSPAEVTAAGEEQLSEVTAKLKPTVDQLRAATADKAVAGAFDPEVEESAINEFGPAEASVPVGGSVTWSVAGPHTIAFNAPEDARGVMVKAPDGTWHANPKAFAPVGGPGAPPPSEEPPDPAAPPGPPVLVDGGSFDGNGFRSSGIILAFGPPGYQYKLTFTKAGTYSYICQIHPDMKGTVKVG